LHFPGHERLSGTVFVAIQTSPNFTIMKTISRIIIAFAFIFACSQVFATDDVVDTDTLYAPDNIIILAQSTYTGGSHYTVVDLDNNEMVIMLYYAVGLNYRLRKVIRTGMKVDLERQKDFSFLRDMPYDRKE